MKAASPERFKRELATLLEDVCRRHTTILFFDDLQWADASTVDLLGYLATRFASMPLLIIGTYRPADVSAAPHPFASLRLSLQARGLCRELPVPLLERQDVDAYLAREFRDNVFPPELGAVIHRRTEGNPLFMVDLIRELCDRGVLTQEDRQWTTTPKVASIQQEMPASVRSLIQRTIDRLEPSHRELLAAASVQGYDFDTAVMARSLNRHPAEVEDGFERIEKAHGLIRRTGEKELPDGPVTLAYQFVHVLYQHALHAALGPARRTGLSGAVAHALVQSHASKTSGIAAQLAVLFEAARELSSAAEYLLIATENALEVFAEEEAIAIARRGLRLLEALPPSPDRARRELRLQILLAAALAARRGYSDAEVEAAHTGRRSGICSSAIRTCGRGLPVKWRTAMLISWRWWCAARCSWRCRGAVGTRSWSSSTTPARSPGGSSGRRKRPARPAA